MKRLALAAFLMVSFLASLAFLACATPAKPKIGLSFSDFRTERWLRERDQMSGILAKAGFEVMIEEADQHPALQNAQIADLVYRGAKVIIAVAEDGESLAGAVDEAARSGVRVIAYDRLINSANIAAYVSFDNIDVGRNQAQGVLALRNRGNFVLLGGSPTDNNARLVRKGQMEVLQPLINRGDIKIVADRWIANWDADKARKAMESIIEERGGKIDAVVASNDNTALGALEAMRAAGLTGKLPISGQDATEAGCASIARGELSVTILKDNRELAPLACAYAIDLARGRAPRDLTPTSLAELTGDPTKSGMVPCKFLQVFQVNKDNLERLVVDSGFQTYEAVYKDLAVPTAR